MTPTEDILRYWFQDGLESGWPSSKLGALWFGGGAALDSQILDRFGHWVHQAVDGGLEAWESPILDRMALVLLLDQFTRNVYRGQARAFAGDARAQALATTTLSAGLDAGLPLVGRVFMAMPLMHAERLDLQDRCVAHFEALLAASPDGRVPDLQGNLAAAREHREIIARFGRFPHRNGVLGRPSSADEQAYLHTARRFGQ